MSNTYLKKHQIWKQNFVPGPSYFQFDCFLSAPLADISYIPTFFIRKPKLQISRKEGYYEDKHKEFADLTGKCLK